MLISLFLKKADQLQTTTLYNSFTHEIWTFKEFVLWYVIVCEIACLRLKNKSHRLGEINSVIKDGFR